MSSKPIIPPGSPLQRPEPRSNSKLVLTVCALIAVHLVILAGLLIQGCKRQETAGNGHEALTNDLPPLPSATSPNPVAREEEKAPVIPAPVPAPATVTTQPTTVHTDAPPPLPTVVANPTAANTVSDSLEPLHTTPTKPVKAATIESAKSTPALPDGPAVTYVVKTGDTLTKIAKAHHTTPKAIRAASNLKTDRILVGQKLQVPQGAAPAASTGSTK